MRILIVDDEEVLRTAVRRALVLEGYDVDEANSGESGIIALRDSRVDLVILDVLMPGLDGLKICRRLRAPGDRTPVLMLTACETVDDRVETSRSAYAGAVTLVHGQGDATYFYCCLPRRATARMRA